MKYAKLISALRKVNKKLNSYLIAAKKELDKLKHRVMNIPSDDDNQVIAGDTKGNVEGKREENI